MKKLSDKEVIERWQKSDSFREAMEKIGLSKGALSNRIANYRKHGIPLKKFKRGKKDWEELKRFAQSLA